MFVPDDIEILLSTEAIDMRKGADGLAGLVRDILQDEPLVRKLFVFQSKQANSTGQIHFPTGTTGGMTFRRAALRMILQGADLKSLSQQLRRANVSIESRSLYPWIF